MLSGNLFNSKVRNITAGVFAISLCCHAANYYVDYAGGNDNNNGTSTTTPWMHCPEDSQATGTAASTTLNSGDTVIFKGGVSYVFTSGGAAGVPVAGFNVNVSGVTYDGNSAGTWGTGKAILTDNNRNPGHTAFAMNTAVANITIRNFSITQLGGSATLPADPGSALAPNPGYGVNMTVSANNIYISDCNFSMLGYWFNQQPMNNASISGLGVGGGSSMGGAFGNITVTNCTFTRMAVGVEFSAGPILTNLTVARCSFTDSLIWCVDIASRGNSAYTDGLNIYGCTFHDYYQFNSIYWTGYGGWPHVDGIFFRCDYVNCTYGTNNNFHNNLFYSTQPTGGGTAPIYVTQGESVNIFNNTFVFSGMANGNITVGGGFFTPGATQTVNIFNNTFYDFYTSDIHIGGTANIYNGVIDLPQKVVVMNNIFYDTATGSGNNAVVSAYDIHADNSWLKTNWFFDHNVYESFNTAGTPIAIGGGGANYSVANVLSQFGWESNAVVGDPKFVNISYGTGTSDYLNDFHLQSNSPAIGAGTNLTCLNLPGLNTDCSGTARQPIGKWTIGAYAVINTNLAAAISVTPVSQNFGTVAVGATTNQTFTVQNTGSGTLIGSASVAAPYSIVSGGSYSLAAGQSQTVTISYNPTAAGTNTQNVTFTGAGGRSGMVSGSAYVSSAIISVTPASRNFGVLPVGATTNYPFTVQNTGSGTLTGSAIVAPPFSIVSGGSYSLAAGQSQTVTVSYSPTVMGTNTQSVTFTGAGGGSGAVSGAAVVPPVVSAIAQSGADVDMNAAGLQIYAGSVVQYSGSASDPNGLPLTWQWIYSLNGGPGTVFQSGTGSVAIVSYNYTANTAGNTYVWMLLASNGYSTAESTLTIGVEAPPPATTNLTFQAGNGVITAPFVLTNGYISQSVQSSDPTTGGQAVFTFTVTNAGTYIIQVLVNAPTDANNSVYVNVDAQPTDPTDIWDIPITSGFVQQIVSWRGNGADGNDQFVPAVFSLPAGVHQLIIRGRESNVQLQSLAILYYLAPPQGLHISSP